MEQVSYFFTTRVVSLILRKHIISSVQGSFEYIPGWWFGRFFPIMHVIIPTGFHMFQRGRYTTNQILALENTAFRTQDFLQFRKMFEKGGASQRCINKNLLCHKQKGIELIQHVTVLLSFLCLFLAEPVFMNSSKIVCASMCFLLNR